MLATALIRIGLMPLSDAQQQNVIVRQPSQQGAAAAIDHANRPPAQDSDRKLVLFSISFLHIFRGPSSSNSQ